MTGSGTLHEAFIEELRDTYDAERQIIGALGTLADAATDAALGDALRSHREQSHGHIERLQQVFDLAGESPIGRRCEGIAGILKEGLAVLQSDMDDVTRDARLIAVSQRAEHYEMAVYGTLRAWALALGYRESAALLDQTLAEEKAADQALTDLASKGINTGAVPPSDDDSGEMTAAAASTTQTTVAPTPHR